MATLEDYFSVQVFLIVLRETLELAIIISVLLAFVHQSFTGRNAKTETTGDYHAIEGTESDVELIGNNAQTSPKNIAETEKLRNYLIVQIWLGGLLGLVACLLFGTIILTIFYILGNDLWAITEHYWEGTFSILASVIISVMGIKILRVSKMQEKWKVKFAAIFNNSDYMSNAIQGHHESRFVLWSEKYAMFILPFVTTLREGMEAIVFIGGIGINENTSIWAIVNSLVSAMIIGGLIGVILYRSGNSLSLQWFLIISTCFLYIVAAGLFSKGVWNFELQRFIDLCDGFDVSETGHGPGSYAISTSVWHVNCCNGELQDDGAFWMMFTAIFGWTNSATYLSVLSYNIYWLVIIIAFTSLSYEEKNGRLPFIPIKWQQRRIKKRLRFTERGSVDSLTPIVR